MADKSPPGSAVPVIAQSHRLAARGVRALHAVRDRQLRAMYVGGRGNRAARRFAAVWAWAFGKGLVPGSRWVTLEVPGRRSGHPTRFPLGIVTVDGQHYLCSMLGDTCNWVLNIRANNGDAIIERRRRRRVHLDEVDIEDRAPLLKAYVEQVPGARPHIPIHPGQPTETFYPVVRRYPLFHISYLTR